MVAEDRNPVELDSWAPLELHRAVATSYHLDGEDLRNPEHIKAKMKRSYDKACLCNEWTDEDLKQVRKIESWANHLTTKFLALIFQQKPADINDEASPSATEISNIRNAAFRLWDFYNCFGVLAHTREHWLGMHPEEPAYHLACWYFAQYTSWENEQTIILNQFLWKCMTDKSTGQQEESRLETMHLIDTPDSRSWSAYFSSLFSPRKNQNPSMQFEFLGDAWYTYYHSDKDIGLSKHPRHTRDASRASTGDYTETRNSIESHYLNKYFHVEPEPLLRWVFVYLDESRIKRWNIPFDPEDDYSYFGNSGTLVDHNWMKHNRQILKIRIKNERLNP